MPPQQQNSSYAARHAAEVARANAEHRDKPIDTGNRRLPPGLKNAVAKLSSMYTKLQEKDEGGKTPKGETFFRGSATVVWPVEFNGERIAGRVTQVIIPLCTIPAKKGDGFDSKEVSFSENWFNFQNLFKMLNVPPPTGPGYDTPPVPVVNGQPNYDDPRWLAAANEAGKRIENYYAAAMKSLTDPNRAGGPVYIEFSTRGWKSPKRPNETDEQFRLREEMVFETWHGLADPKKINVRPSTEVANEVTTNGQGSHSEPFEEPPSGVLVMPDVPPAEGSPELAVDEDQIAAWVETAMNDPDGATTDGASASYSLEKAAWANGWTKEQTKNAADWAHVGEMALSPPPAVAEQTATAVVVPEVGNKYKFCKRTKDGDKLKDVNGKEFPPKEVEVTSVDTENKTCTLKTTKDGKDIVDMKSRKPVAIKWEWLE